MVVCMNVAEYHVVLKKEDVLILESFKSVLEGLADYLGEGYELVLHSLEDMNKSVIKIINGHHTGRREGAPITDLALTMLSHLLENNDLASGPNAITYFTRNKKGEPLKSTTIAIRGKDGKIIGLICINFYLNTPFLDILDSYTNSDPNGAGIYKQESFVDNVEELIRNAYEPIREMVYSNTELSATQRNKEIVAQLHQKGIFKLKNSVFIVAKLMGISRNTVYLHLRRLSAENEK